MIVKGSSHSTITNYTQIANHFLNQVKLENISTESVIDYFFNLKDRLASSTFNLYKSGIKNLLIFLEKDNIKFPKSSKLDKKLPEFITLKFLFNIFIALLTITTPVGKNDCNMVISDD